MRMVLLTVCVVMIACIAEKREWDWEWDAMRRYYLRYAGR